MLAGRPLTINSLLRAYPVRIATTWLMTLGETAMLALVPLFIGFALDGLLTNDLTAFWQLTALLLVLIVVSVVRRVYDTRIYGTLRVAFAKEQALRGTQQPVSELNAQIGMGRELIQFLEESLPMVMAGIVQLTIAVIILGIYSPVLAFAAIVAAIWVLVVYALFHSVFFRLNAALNVQSEIQVSVLEKRSARPTLAYLTRVRRLEVRISDAEAVLYGLVFLLLLGAILFNLWYATTVLTLSTGAIFAIVSNSWDFVDGTLTLPMTLQNWTRLSEIMRRLNKRLATQI